ncbi:helix-turn-helix domain-containing protein (plasmid) [Agrobacterium tumefaciens]|uniref:winged helix-turn-helix transcriptional regulator n=1 Tax=Agrobacterium tumefaciens TaxID=358 RepID=UPI001F279ED7|nr:helix-turn-helix domain-containing protein [Agrobacterium tumefaciens]
MARSIDLIGEWGSLMILRQAFGGTTRFDDFQKQLGISRNLLSTRLKKLVDGGILERQPTSASGRRQEYVLTPMGEDLVSVVVAMRQWGDRWLFVPDPHPADMYDAVDGSKIAKLEVRSENGRLIDRQDLKLRRHRAR